MSLEVGKSCCDFLNIKKFVMPDGCDRYIVDIVFEYYDNEGTGFFKVTMLSKLGVKEVGLITAPKTKLQKKPWTKQAIMEKATNDKAWKRAVKQYEMGCATS
ncbi:MAG: hypothetical protein ACO3XZ_07620 [Ilumatobacteraceae bacterium]